MEKICVFQKIKINRNFDRVNPGLMLTLIYGQSTVPVFLLIFSYFEQFMDKV
ncbi:MAG: hypothetical protein WKF92_07055 [Pyrinomonadaceae bacterium]